MIYCKTCNKLYFKYTLKRECEVIMNETIKYSLKNNEIQEYITDNKTIDHIIDIITEEPLCPKDPSHRVSIFSTSADAELFKYFLKLSNTKKEVDLHKLKADQLLKLKELLDSFQ